MTPPKDIPAVVWAEAEKSVPLNAPHRRAALTWVSAAILAERERCATVAEGDGEDYVSPDWNGACEEIARRIRAGSP